MAEQLGTPKAEFLDSVRRALGRRPAAPQPPYWRLQEDLPLLEEQAQRLRARLQEDRSTILERMARVAKDGGWNVSRTSGPEEAIGYIQSLATSMGIERIVRSEQAVFSQVPVDAALQSAGISVTEIAHDETHSRNALRQEIAEAGMGITGADYAVAETGSVIVVPRQGLSRLVSVVPPVHVALVRPEDVIDNLDDLFLLRRLEYHRNGGDMGSYLNFITGPSRTADIEQTLVVGVHGPKEVHLVLLG
ncbi:MAG: lactate utilization protein [Chloroflexi bacterium]|nr:lactate utilization protein [Chloroflexota bacterium]